jgi:hypothetical protein
LHVVVASLLKRHVQHHSTAKHWLRHVWWTKLWLEVNGFFFLSPPWFSRINLQIPKQLFNLFFHQILSLFFWLVFVLLEIVKFFFFNFILLQFFCISYFVPIFLMLFVLFVLIFIVNFFNDSLLYFLFLSNLILIFLIVFFLLNWSRI